jgi:hypothetical protein
MAPNSHFSSSVGDPFIDSLRQRLERMAIAVMHLEENIVLPVREDPRLVRKYLYLYTLPILEIAGLLGAEPSKLGLWANVHMSLSLHLRAIDYVLDGDSDRGHVTDQARRAYLYLSHAQDLVRQEGLCWGPSQANLYSQFYDYEVEARDGFFHDLSSSWRRVSPLCVVPETYLVSEIPAALSQRYRWFLGWSLFQADCDDVVKDLTSGCSTPVTQLVREKITGVFGDMAASADVLAKIKAVLLAEYRSLYSAIEDFPLWRAVLEQMWKGFSHEDDVVGPW